jgi:hypothetical protein
VFLSREQIAPAEEMNEAGVVAFAIHARHIIRIRRSGMRKKSYFAEACLFATACRNAVARPFSPS